MSNLYAMALRDLIAKDFHELKEVGDQWRTPDWLFQAINCLYGPLVVDLFTDGQNSKCPEFFTADDNALRQDWGAAIRRVTSACRVCDGTGYFYGDSELGPCVCRKSGAYANPPYSAKRAAGGRKAAHVTGMTHIMAKAFQEHQNGVRSVWLVKSATSESWWPNETASQIIHIKGRIGFEVPLWFNPVPGEPEAAGAGFGASIVIFNGEDRLQQPEQYITREKLMEIGLPLAGATADERQRWIRMWDEL